MDWLVELDPNKVRTLPVPVCGVRPKAHPYMVLRCANVDNGAGKAGIPPVPA